MVRRTLFTLMAVAAAFSARPMFAADAATVIPAGTHVAVRLKNPEKLFASLGELASKINPQYAGIVRTATDGFSGNAISNITRDGVKMSGDWWITVRFQTDDEPQITYFITASDAGAMQDALGDGFAFMKHEDLGIYSPNPDAIDAVKQTIAGKTKSLSATIAKGPAALLASADLALYVDLAGITATFSDQIDEAQQQANVVFENPGALPPGFDPSLLPMMRDFVDVAFRGVKDADALTMGLNVSADGLAMEDLLTFKAGSATGKAFANQTTSDLNLINSIPGDGFLLMGASVDMSALTQWGLKMAGAMIADAAGRKALEEAMAEMAGLKLNETASAVQIGDLQNGLFRTTTIIDTPDGAKLRASGAKSAKALGTVKTPGVTTTYTYKPEAETAEQTKVDVMLVKQEFDAGPAAALQNQIMGALFGAEGIATRAAYLPGRVVQTQGGGLPAMAAALKAIKARTGLSSKAAAAVSATRKKLGGKANIVVMLDLAGGAAAGLNAWLSSPGAPVVPVDSKALKDIAANPSYIGMSMAFETDAVRTRMVIPAEQMQSIGKLVMILAPLGGALGQGGF